MLPDLITHLLALQKHSTDLFGCLFFSLASEVTSMIWKYLIRILVAIKTKPKTVAINRHIFGKPLDLA